MLETCIYNISHLIKHQIQEAMSSVCGNSGFVVNISTTSETEVVQSVKVYDSKADHLALNLIDGCHCFAILYVKDIQHLFQKEKKFDKMIRIEAGRNKQGQIEVVYKQIKTEKEINEDSTFITQFQLDCQLKTSKKFTFAQILRHLKERLDGVEYSLTGMNCYRVCQLILKFLNDKKGPSKISKRYEQVAKNSTQSVVSLGMGFFKEGLYGGIANILLRLVKKPQKP